MNKEPNIFNYLISNKGFIDWVNNPNETNNYFWNKWIEEKPEYAKDFIKAREFVQKLQFKDEKLTGEELNELLGKIIEKENSEILNYDVPFLPHLNLTIAFKYTAVIILALATSLSIYFFNFSDSTINKSIASSEEWEVVTNPRGEKSKVNLPDGTIVYLNYESTLKYPKKFNSKIRQVELKGEAFFDVYHIDGYPFIVKTGVLETQVFGTSFNINSFDQNEKLNIALVTGKVKVKKIESSDKEVNTILLEPGEMVSYDKTSKEIIKKEFDIETTLAWKEGTMIFEDVSFKEFIDKLERWYGVNFQIYGNTPKDWKFNGRYENEKIESILIGVNFVYKLDYKIQGNNIIIKI